MPRPTRTQAERRATSERRLLDAAAELIAERGTTNVSFAEIARAAKCSHGLPGYLFGSKTDLLLALVADVLERFRNEMVAPHIGDAKGLEAVLKATEAFLVTLDRPLPRTRVIYVLIGEAMGAPPELKAALDAYHDAVRRMVSDMYVEGIERGEIRHDIDLDATSTALFGMVRGIGALALLDPKSVDVPAVTKSVLDIAVRGLAVDPTAWNGLVSGAKTRSRSKSTSTTRST